MNDKKFKEYLKERYYPRIDWYDKKSVFNKRLTYLIQIPVIIMASITPIFAALEFYIYTVIFSIGVAVGIGILRFGNFEYNWRNYRNTWEDLTSEKIHYDTKIGSYKKSKNPKKLFVTNIENILSRERVRWNIKSDNDNYEFISN